MKRYALVLLVLAGCKTPPSTTDAGVGVDGGAVSVAPELASKACDVLQMLPGKRMAECCGGSASALQGAECTRLLGASLADGSVRVDAAALDACTKAMNASLVGCDWVTPSAPPLPDACKDLVQGQGAAHAKCRSPLDCQAGLHCVNNACTGPEKLGTTCGQAVDAFAAATRQTDVEAVHPTCAAQCSLVTHRCEAVPEAGAQCFANGGCASGQLCIDGKCAVATAGAAGQPCAGTTCADGLRCVNKQCIAKAATNESCSSDFDCAKGGCASREAGRTCGMTCSHAGDLAAIRQKLDAIPVASAPSASANQKPQMTLPTPR